MTHSMSLADIDATEIDNFAWGLKVASSGFISSIPEMLRVFEGLGDALGQFKKMQEGLGGGGVIQPP